MRSINKVTQPSSSVLAWLDGVQMSEQDRKIAKAYLRKTEAVLDAIWLISAWVRAAFARSPASRTPGGNGLRGQKRVVVHLS